MLRPVGLVRVAAEAEGLRIKRQIGRSVTRVMLLLIALVFLVGAVVFAHVAAYYLIRLQLLWTQYSAAGVIAGADFVLALVLVAMSLTSRPGRVEREALEIRRRALANIGSTMAISTMTAPVLRMVLRSIRRSR